MPTEPAHVDVRSDAGFTLIEMVIAISIAGALIGVLGVALALGLRTTEAAGDQINEAAWAQIAATRLLADVHSAEDVSTEAACDATAAGTLLASFMRTDLSDDLTEEHTDWWLDGGELQRTTCDEDGVRTSDPTSETVATDLATDPGSHEIACDATSCTASWTANEADRVYELTATRRVR